MLEEVMSKRFSHALMRLGPTRSGTGFTLVEMLVVIAVLGFLLTLAASSFTTYFEKFRVKRAAETLAGTLYQAKSEAIKRNRVVRLVITISSGDGSKWCYGLTTGASCDCTIAVPNANSCWLDSNVETSVTSADFRGVSLIAPATGTAFSFQPLRGTVGGGTVVFQSANGYRVNTVVSSLGRIKTCSPKSHYIGGGYTQC